MSSEKFCLRWNDFESNISSAFKHLRNDEDFFDITLACEDDEQTQAHRVILAACSPFFRHVLRKNPHKHPLLYLKGVKFNDLQSVLCFMYNGEVNVAQEDLNSFLAVAEELKIKGLTQSNNSKEPNFRNEKTNSQKLTPQRLLKTSQSKPLPYVPPDDDVQEITPIKSEPREQPIARELQEESPNSSVEPSDSQSSNAIQAVEQSDEALWDVQENYDEYGQYDQNYQGSNQVWSVDHDGVEHQIEMLIQKQPEGGYQCTVCGHSNNVKKDLKRHVETHIETPGYPCNFCGKQFKTRNSLNTHLSTKHREERKQYY